MKKENGTKKAHLYLWAFFGFLLKSRVFDFGNLIDAACMTAAIEMANVLKAL